MMAIVRLTKPYNRSVDMLIISAVWIEAQKIRDKIRDIDHVFVHDKNYDIGFFGALRVAHVMCSSVGSGTCGGAMNTLHAALLAFRPKCVLMIGIAYGLNQAGQMLADVAVAESVVCYEPQRLSSEVNYRGEMMSATKELLDLMRSTVPDDGTSLHFGLFVSGEKLIANKEFRNELIKQWPHAIAGDMEIGGMASVCANQQLPWAAVKAICDWADESKDYSCQPIASKNAVDFCEKVFSSDSAVNAIDDSISTGAVVPDVTSDNLVFSEISNAVTTCGLESIVGEKVSMRIGLLLSELALNSRSHGGATNIVIETKERGISLIDDGMAFNPLALSADDSALGQGGGTYAIRRFLLELSEVCSINYERLEDNNILTVLAVTGPTGLPTSERCRVIFPPIELLRSKKMEEYFNSIIYPTGCSELYIDLNGVILNMSMARIIVDRVINRAGPHTKLIVKHRDEWYIDFLQQMFQNNPNIIVQQG